MAKVKFISYDGSYPNLCSGTLVVEVDGIIKEFKHCLSSGGSVWFDDDWSEHVEQGAWRFIPEEDMDGETWKGIEEVVNENVPWGCCGGCV